MKSVLAQKCSKCGAVMRFDPNTQKVICDHCGNNQIFNVDKVKAEELLGNFDFLNQQRNFFQESAEKLPIYQCVSCGAELIAPKEQFALTCPYCRSNIILTDKVSGNLRPSGVIPFKFTSKELPKRMSEFYKTKLLLPKRFFSNARMKNITGVYVPFWLFSGKISGEASFVGYKTSITGSREYETTTTRYYQFVNSVSLEYKDVPVDASKRIDDRLMDSMEPFEMEDLKPFEMGYLAGFTADRFDEPATAMERRAKARIESTADEMLDDKTGEFYGVRRVSGQLQNKMKAEYVLFPIYLFDIVFEGKTYQFAVNGQTGKTVGTVPTGRTEEIMYFLKRFGLISIPILAFFVIKYFLGW